MFYVECRQEQTYRKTQLQKADREKREKCKVSRESNYRTGTPVFSGEANIAMFVLGMLSGSRRAVYLLGGWAGRVCVYVCVRICVCACVFARWGLTRGLFQAKLPK